MGDANEFVASAEATVLKGMTGGRLSELKGAFPKVAAVARDEHSRIPKGDLVPQARAAYVDFLLALAAGIEQAKAQ